MEEEHKLLQRDTHHASFNQVISSLRQKGTYSDATLVCNGKFYHVHKLVITVCSEYFSQILENTEGKHPMVILTGIQSSDIELLLDYMYIGEVNVRMDKLPSLMRSAEILKVKGLVNQEEGPRISSYYSMSGNQISPLKGEMAGENKYSNLSPGRLCTPGIKHANNPIKQDEDEVEDVSYTEHNTTLDSSGSEAQSVSLYGHSLGETSITESNSAVIHSSPLELRRTSGDLSASISSNTTVSNFTNDKLEIPQVLDIAVPESYPLSQQDQEIHPYTLYVQKHGSQMGKRNSYHDTLGYTYRFQIDKRRDHLGGTYICYMQKKAISCKGRVLYRNGVYKMTQAHDKCQPNYKEAETRRMRNELKNQALLDLNSSAIKIVENYCQKKTNEGHFCPLSQDNLLKKRMCAQINFHRAKKRKREAENLNKDMTFEENHQKILLQTLEKDEALSMNDNGYSVPDTSC